MLDRHNIHLRKIGILFLVFFIVFTGVGGSLGTPVTYAASMEEIYVSSEGDDTTGDGTSENPFKTLYKAYEEVSSTGGIIYVLNDITLSPKSAGKFLEFTEESYITITTAPGVTDPAVIERDGGGTLFDVIAGQLTLNNIIIDGKEIASDGRIVNVYNSAILIIEEGAILRNNINNLTGSAVYIRDAASSVIMTGGEIRGNKHSTTGALYMNNGTFTMTGGLISENSGGGVQVRGGSFHLSDDAVITGNTIGESERNIYLEGTTLLTLDGNFVGQAGITALNRMATGKQFGVAAEVGLAGLENLFADNGPFFAGYADTDNDGVENDLVWQFKNVLTQPATDREIAGIRPILKGETLSNATVTIEFVSTTDPSSVITKMVPANENGDWELAVDEDLNAGAYTVKVTANKDNTSSLTETREIIVVDKTALENKVTEISEENLVETNYTPESWSVLQEALNTAQFVLGNENATQEDINNALTALEAAYDNLEFIPVVPGVDKTTLQGKITSIGNENLVETDYTAESWQALQEVLNTASTVLEDENASQEQVDNALKALNNAYENLEDATPALFPGGVETDLISWFELTRGWKENGSDDGLYIQKVGDLADSNREWTIYADNTSLNGQALDVLGSKLINYHLATVPKNNRVMFETNSVLVAPTSGAREVFSVQVAGTNGFPWDLGGAISSQVKYIDGTITADFGTTSPKTFTPSEDLTSPNIMNIWSQTDDWALSLNGHQEHQVTTNQTSWGIVATQFHYIGGAHNQPFYRGNVAEVLVFNSKLNEDERQKVNSYLALKYGITLQEASGNPVDYIASDGSPMWTAANNTGYGYRITGIGKDGALDQRQSKSEEDGALVAIALGDQFTKTSEENPVQIGADKSFFTFSDNGKDATYTVVNDYDMLPSRPDSEQPFTATVKIMERTFKVDKTDWQDQNITLQLDGGDQASNKLYLLISADETIGAEDNLLPLDGEGKVTLSSSELLDGGVFTFVQFVDKKPLQDKQTEIINENLTETDYTPESWSTLQDALNVALSVLSDEDATQEQVDNALTALEAARDNLVPVSPGVDKTALQIKVIEINDENLVETNYTPESWSALQDALNTAQSVLRDENATQEQVDNALTALEAARDNLVPVSPGVDKTALQIKVIEINDENLVETNYTPESWLALQDALNTGQSVLRDENATQEQVDNALTALGNMRESLVHKLIVPSTGALQPNVSADVYEYSMNVDNSTSELQFTVSPTNPDATVTVNGNVVTNGQASNPIALNVGENAITIVITERDGTTYTYTISVTRAASPSGGDSNSGNNGNGSDSGNSGSVGTPSPSQPPRVENITVNVEASGKGVVAQTVIERTTNADGTKSDKVTFEQTKAIEAVQKTLAAGAPAVRIVIPDVNDEVKDVRVDLPLASLKTVQESNLDLEIYTDNGMITIPNASLRGVNQNLYFYLLPIKQEDERKQVEERAKKEQLVQEVLKDGNVYVVDRPFTIETNMPSSSVQITLPMSTSHLSVVAAEKEAFLANLAIFIEHSDGERKLVKPEIGDYSEGKLGLTFSIEKFSTFTILNLNRGIDGTHSAYMKGFTDGTFKPEQALTRAQIAMILSRVLDIQNSGTAVVYPDVPKNHWASEAIRFTTANGLMQGMPDGSFQPERAISRAEMATIIARLQGLEGIASHSFSDVSGHWAEDSISNVFQGGYMEGMPNGSFQPNKTLTRAEAVVVFNRVLDRGPLYNVSASWSDVSMSHWAFYHIEEASRDHSYKKRVTGGETIVE